MHVPIPARYESILTAAYDGHTHTCTTRQFPDTVLSVAQHCLLDSRQKRRADSESAALTAGTRICSEREGSMEECSDNKSAGIGVSLVPNMMHRSHVHRPHIFLCVCMLRNRMYPSVCVVLFAAVCSRQSSVIIALRALAGIATV